MWLAFLVFAYGPSNTIRKRYVWTQIFLIRCGECGNFAYFGIFFPRQIYPVFSETTPWWLMRSYPFTPNLQKYNISEVGRNGSIIIFHLSKLRKAKFFILCDEISLVRLQEKYEIYNSCFFFSVRFTWIVCCEARLMVTETWINTGGTRQRLATSTWAKGTSEVGSTTSTCSTTPCRPVKWSNYCKSSVLGKSSPIVRSCDQAMWPVHVIRSRDRVMWQVTTSENVFRGYRVPPMNNIPDSIQMLTNHFNRDTSNGGSGMLKFSILIIA